MPFSNLPPTDTPLQILLVEDSIPYAVLVKAQLQILMDYPHEVHHVDSVRPAVESLKSGHEFDLLILDMHLPDSHGLDTFQAVYPHARDIPIVILSSDDSVDLAIECVQHGAQDYLIKSEDDGYKLIRSLRFAIERKRRLHAEHELEAARRIQESLLPEHAPTIKGFDIAGSLDSAVEAAGDYYDFLVPMPAVGEGSIGFAIADVSGHGLGPAIVMAEARACLHSFSTVESDLGRILELTNTVLLRSRNNHFVTLVLAYIDSATNSLMYASAGHQSWHINVQGVETELPCSGPPLGMLDPNLIDDVSWTTSSPVPLASGDLILLTTDGSEEARSKTGEMYGRKRVMDVVRAHQTESANEIVEHLREAVRDYTSGTPQADDITIVVIKCQS